MGFPEAFNLSCDFEVLYMSVINNIDYFYFIREKYSYANKFVFLLREFLSHLHWYEKNLKDLCNDAHFYDFSTNVQGNGFRSFILIFERCFSECYKFCKALISARSSFFFRPETYIKETESLLNILYSLRSGVKYINKILTENKDTQNLMAGAFLSTEELIDQCATIQQLGFYGRHQGFYKLPGWVCPKLEVKEEIFIPPDDILLNTVDGSDTVLIQAPSSHIPSSSVRCLLLSTAYRDGQVVNEKKLKKEARSPCLLFHCHGGGFIAQNPESHEIYLRHWAHDLNVPILSIDYSLSPGAPFPRALEETLFAYAWALKNADKLGWTGEVICCAGDSAGGNVVMGIVLKLISLNLRLPDSILCAYTPLILDLVASPSRLLCWVDPLLPLGFMISCLDAYAGDMQTDGDEYDEKPICDSSAPRSRKISRKISSISEIFDSSMMFLKECEWAEVEANEPPANDLDFQHTSSDEEVNKYQSANSYISSFVKQKAKNCESSLTFDSDNDDNHVLFDFHKDLMFGIKSKCQEFANSGINRFCQAFISTSLYQKYILPIVPLNTYNNQLIQSSFTKSNSTSVHQKIRKLKIVSKNPFMSPLLASDEYLKSMPPVYFVSPTFDPCLDDSITFAKRLASLNRQVVVDVLDGLPHGFLNFLPFSQEAHSGSNLCVRRLKEAMKI